MKSLDTTKDKFEDRILDAAIRLFGSRGYRGVSTRDIAVAAKVNEVTIYRHYPRKRDLYIAAITVELERTHLGGEELKEIDESPDLRQALFRTLRLIEATLWKQPDMLRLLLYGSLEGAADMDILIRRHLEEFVEILTAHIEPWIAKDETLGQSPRALVMGIAAIAVFYQSIERLFPSGTIDSAALAASVNHCLSGN